MSTPVELGADVSKARFDVAVEARGKIRHRGFTNTTDGFRRLLAWLAGLGITRVHACMESTGGYERALAEFLHEHGHVVSIVNPSRIHGHARSQLRRTKTDRADARLILDFCQKNHPEAWTPPPPELERLRALLGRLDDLKAMRQQEASRLETARQRDERRSIETVVAFLDGQITELEREIGDHIDSSPGLKRDAELLKTIKGVGERTARMLLLVALRRFTNARQAVAFVGLAPDPHESGTMRQRARLSKIGSKRLRTALYFPALAAARHDPAFRALRERLEAKGKRGLVVVSAVMRKLVCVAFGVLKSGVAYDPQRAAAKAR